MRAARVALIVAAVAVAAARAPAAAAEVEPPEIPVGLDAYRQWDKWPLQRIGARAYMRSTYDRRGGNEGADASHFLYQEADDFNVTLDVAGHPGVLYFARYNHWHGSPWHYVVDGVDTIVRETSTADPNKPVANSTFEPRELFPRPLAWTWSDTKGADLSWAPIGFEKSFRMAYSRTRYGTGYYIYHQYAPGTKLSRPIESWDAKTPPAADVLKLIDRAGADLAPPNIEDNEHTIVFDENRLASFFAPRGPGVIRAVEVSAPRDKVAELAKLRIVATWDDRAEPSVDAPLPLFFGAGTLYNRDGREHLVKAFPVNIRFDEKRVHLSCYFPMPFFRSASIGLAAREHLDIGAVEFRVRWEPLTSPPNHVGYFHATYRDHGRGERGKDLVLLDTRGIEGSRDWTGSFVGTSFIFSRDAVLQTLEGDPRFFFDDSNSPQAYGTGTEEWGGGGDYWGGRNMTLPFAGHPVGAPSRKEAKNDLDKIQSAYRFLLADLFPFGKNARIQLEHGATNDMAEHYETVTYWYGLPGASLVQTDELKVGHAASERAHGYASPDASPPHEITSRYELGPDTMPVGSQRVVIYPPHTDTGRTTTGASEFTLKLDPDNWGVLLRRKLDYQFPNQRAEVSVQVAENEWKPAGVWYTAGSNTCVHSNPPEELGATRHEAQTSNRRFRDDEFLIGRALTRGKSSVRVRVKFTPVDRPLFPGQPFPHPPKWSEIRYTAYSYVMPPAP